MPMKSCLLTMLLALPSLAMAGDYVDIEKRLSPEQRHETGLDTLSPAQLARLNELLRGQDVAAAKVAPAPMSTPAIQRFAGMDTQVIRSSLRSAHSGWAPGTVFALANGQRWQVLKGRIDNYALAAGHAVSIEPGLAGRWFLRFDADLPAARVVRIE